MKTLSAATVDATKKTIDSKNSIPVLSSIFQENGFMQSPTGRNPTMRREQKIKMYQKHQWPVSMKTTKPHFDLNQLNPFPFAAKRISFSKKVVFFPTSKRSPILNNWILDYIILIKFHNGTMTRKSSLLQKP